MLRGEVREILSTTAKRVKGILVRGAAVVERLREAGRSKTLSITHEVEPAEKSCALRVEGARLRGRAAIYGRVSHREYERALAPGSSNARKGGTQPVQSCRQVFQNVLRFSVPEECFLRSIQLLQQP
jgi:hypothetical protein